ncbi:MAG: oligosaccharide flippase family protein [Chloroflexi bacterium]|nr:oligosaccharide flippase family protein [Chloroflexota bacterium]
MSQIEDAIHKLFAKEKPVPAPRASILQNVSTVLGGNVLAKAMGFVTTWILVRHLTPADYGIFSVLDMVARLSVELLTTGFNWWMIKSIAANRDDPLQAWPIARTVLKVELIYGFTLLIALYLGAGIFAQWFFKKPELAFYLRLCSVGVLGTVLLGYRTSIFQAFGQFRWDAAFSVGHSAIYLIIILVLLFTHPFNIRIISVFYVSLPLIISGIALVLIRKDFFRDGDNHFPKLWDTMRDSYLWLLCYTLCLWFSGQFHILVLLRYFSLHEVGLYGFTYKIYMTSLMLMSAINVVLLPTFSGVRDKKVLRQSFLKVLKSTTGVSLGFFATIPFLGLFVDLFAGARYAGATTMLQILIFGAATSTMLSPPVNILFALDKFRLLALCGLGMVTINLTGHLLVTRYYGGIGAASIQVLSHLLMNSYFTFNAWKAIYSKDA